MTQPIAFIFPGQGSQAVGMGADVYRASPAARAIFDAADTALGFALSRLCFEGPDEALRETINTQPALVTTSLALLAALQESAGAPALTDGAEPPLSAPLTPSWLAGHSVGEYAALAASGALDVAATVRLARERGRLMHEEGSTIPGGMAAVLGMDAPALERVCAEATARTRAALTPEEAAAHPGAGHVVLANDNAPGQIIISGERRALEAAMELAKVAGARRVAPLAVSGAFHSPVMAPAAAGLARAVDAALIHNAAIPIVSNISATPISAADDIRRELAGQIVSPVQWTRTIEWLVAQGVTLFVEIGAGQVLTGLMKRIAREATALSVSTAADVDAIAPRVAGALR